MDDDLAEDVRESVAEAAEHGESATEAALLAAERAGLVVHWSNCSRCGRPRDEHGVAMLCPH